jgi:molybdenum cofactor cytidylyltransferase
VNTASTHAAVVLAAGGSRRLGRPKQLLTRDGETLVHRAARLALDTSPRRLLVVVGAHRDEVANALHGIDCETVLNREWQHGLAGSLRAAAARLRPRDAPILILGCDQPALEIAHLEALVAGAAASSAHCAATLHGELRGIPAVVPHAWLAHVDALSGDRGFGARLRALAHGSLFALDAQELACDLDTEDHVRTAVARGWLDAACG